MPDATPAQIEASTRRSRWRWGPRVLGALLLVLVLLIVFWNWDWFLPLVNARASAAIGRRVTVQHLHVRLGRTVIVRLDNVQVDNPDGFEQTAPLARIVELSVAADAMAYIHGRGVVLPRIDITRPVIAATALPNGRNNFTLTLPSGKTATEPPAAPPQVGDLRIIDGTARFVDPHFKSDFILAIATRDAGAGHPEALVVDAHGTYGGQPVTGRFIGGALLTVRDAAHPYPIDLRLVNGPTHVSLVGTVRNPLKFAGAALRLQLSGTDAALLFPLTGIPIPQTPPFSISGNLDYARPRIRLTDFTGRLGSSDINGNITEDPGIGGKPDVTLDLWSRRVDLADLGGFVGTPAGKLSTPGQTVAQKRVLAKTEAANTLLPTTPINLPKLRAANVHLTYKGAHIENKATPFDDIAARIDLVDGRVTVHPLSLAVGHGRVVGNIDLTPGARDVVQARADIRFQHIDLSRIMQATKTFKGQGTIGGEARIDANGNSLASMMAQGNGEAKFILLGGGDLSALLVDISGLEFGNAMLSALGVPNRAQIQCFVTDLPMRDGIVSTKALLLDTDEGRITGSGTANFRDQSLDFSLTTRSRHFSIGSLPGPINITGPMGKPSIRPGAEVVARAGAATGLGILLTPLGALLPTIQFGVGDDNACTRATLAEKQPLKVPSLPHRRVHK